MTVSTLAQQPPPTQPQPLPAPIQGLLANWVSPSSRSPFSARSRYATRHNGNPDETWSMGEKLLNALIFQRDDQLAALDYSEPEAVERLRVDFGVTADEFPGVLEQIRSQL